MSRLRDRVLFETAYICGTRASEACGIDIEDLDLRLDDEHIRLHGTGGTVRTVLLDDRGYVALLKLCLARTGYRFGALFRPSINAGNLLRGERPSLDLVPASGGRASLRSDSSSGLPALQQLDLGPARGSEGRESPLWTSKGSARRRRRAVQGPQGGGHGLPSVGRSRTRRRRYSSPRAGYPVGPAHELAKISTCAPSPRGSAWACRVPPAHSRTGNGRCRSGPVTGYLPSESVFEMGWCVCVIPAGAWSMVAGWKTARRAIRRTPVTSSGS